MSRPPVVVSVDVDPVDLHLIGYGHRGLPADPLVYQAALPRLIEVFARTGVAATFFVVGRDAAAQAVALAACADAGHELASHSMTHPMPLSSLPAEALRRELVESKRAVETVARVEVHGFRAPNWDVTPGVLEALAAAGYRYDASIFPSWLLLAARGLLALKATDRAALLRMRLWPMRLDRAPGMVRTAAGPIAAIPISVTPGIGFPVYHTARYLLTPDRFLRQLDGFARRAEPLFYPLHAVDALGLEEDAVDRRLARHPGMERRLAEKLELLEVSLAAIAERFEPMTYRDFLGRFPSNRRASSRPA
jgi:peptidoglycan/xylan/chitin deacetylase (PgdA/CDA1 family)